MKMPPKYTILSLKCLLIAGTALLCLPFAGCQKQDPDMKWINHVYNGRHLRPYNPHMVFDLSVKNRAQHIPAEAFGRDPWPVSNQAVRYQAPETIVYEAYVSDRIYVGPNGIPDNQFHYHLRGYRTGAEKK